MELRRLILRLLMMLVFSEINCLELDHLVDGTWSVDPSDATCTCTDICFDDRGGRLKHGLLNWWGFNRVSSIAR